MNLCTFSSVGASLCTATFWVAKGFERRKKVKFDSSLSFSVKPEEMWINAFLHPHLFLVWMRLIWMVWMACEWYLFYNLLWLTFSYSLLSLVSLTLFFLSIFHLFFSSCPSRVDSLASFYRFSFASISKLNKKALDSSLLPIHSLWIKSPRGFFYYY